MLYCLDKLSQALMYISNACLLLYIRHEFLGKLPMDLAEWFLERAEDVAEFVQRHR